MARRRETHMPTRSSLFTPGTGQSLARRHETHVPPPSSSFIPRTRARRRETHAPPHSSSFIPRTRARRLETHVPPPSSSFVPRMSPSPVRRRETHTPTRSNLFAPPTTVEGSFPWSNRFHATSFQLAYSPYWQWVLPLTSIIRRHGLSRRLIPPCPPRMGGHIPCGVDGEQHENHVLLHPPFFSFVPFYINKCKYNK